ncbi:uracil-DNA glycosylase [Sinomonas gamaensis]|uniref:uracil-DNA glycosylase n=1 Tax=Sinomonas gamaensis TaxID=2565624 RepID=UPI003B82EF28
MSETQPLFELPGEDEADRLSAMASAPLESLVHPEWAPALAPAEPELRTALRKAADDAASGAVVLPPPPAVLRAFREPLSAVKVLVVGQDPYPTPGHSMGLCFSVAANVTPLPRSLANIFRELGDDVGNSPACGDLTAWAEQGVLLLNRVLTVRAGESGAHRRVGWEAVTDAAVRAVVERGKPLVAILWGRDALAMKPLLGTTPVIASAHPSPLSASRGFFGSRPFSRANALLVEQGATPIVWA